MSDHIEKLLGDIDQVFKDGHELGIKLGQWLFQQKVDVKVVCVALRTVEKSLTAASPEAMAMVDSVIANLSGGKDDV